MATIKQAVEEDFVMDYDNMPGVGPKMLFRKWDDGTMSLATPEHIVEFIEKSAFVAKVREIVNYQQSDIHDRIDELAKLLPPETP